MAQCILSLLCPKLSGRVFRGQKTFSRGFLSSLAGTAFLPVLFIGAPKGPPIVLWGVLFSATRVWRSLSW